MITKPKQNWISQTETKKDCHLQSAIQKWLPSFFERGNPRFIEKPFDVKDVPHLKALTMRMSRATKGKIEDVKSVKGLKELTRFKFQKACLWVLPSQELTKRL